MMDFEKEEGVLIKIQAPHFATLNPIHPLQKDNNEPLPSLSNLNLPHHPECDRFYLHPNHSWASGSNIVLYDDTSSIYSTTKQYPQKILVPPLSNSTSFSSLRSVASSTKSKAGLLARAATFTARRRGRPRKPPVVVSAPDVARHNTNEMKLIDMSCYFNEEQQQQTTLNTPSPKPRWQDAERLELLEAIVKEKELDDMTTIRWDRISLAVGRAKKACKDQWRREVLPNLMRGLKSSSNNKKSSPMDYH